MRPCAFPTGTYLGCGYWTLDHPTLCYFHCKKDLGLLDSPPPRGKPRSGSDPADVVSGERLSLIRGMAHLGASELQIRVALKQVNPRAPERFAPHWKGRRRLEAVR